MAITKEALPVLSRARILRVVGVPVKQTLTGSLNAGSPRSFDDARSRYSPQLAMAGQAGIEARLLRKVHAGRGDECSAALTVLAGGQRF